MIVGDLSRGADEQRHEQQAASGDHRDGDARAVASARPPAASSSDALHAPSAASPATPKARPRRCARHGLRRTRRWRPAAARCRARRPPTARRAAAGSSTSGVEQQRQAAQHDQPREAALAPLGAAPAAAAQRAEQEAGRHRRGEHAGRQRPAAALRRLMATASPSGAMTAAALSRPQPSSARSRGLRRHQASAGRCLARAATPVAGRRAAGRRARGTSAQQQQRPRPRRSPRRPAAPPRTPTAATSAPPSDEAADLAGLRDGVAQGVADDVRARPSRMSASSALRALSNGGASRPTSDQHGEDAPTAAAPGTASSATRPARSDVADDHDAAPRVAVRQRRQQRPADAAR